MTQILSARSIAVYVTAIEMTRQEYNQIRGWELPADENGDDEGFLIEDPAGQENTPDYDGFVQWLPKAEFERKFTVLDEDACCEAEPKCADSTMGMNAVSPSCSSREDIYMLSQLAANPAASHILRNTVEEKLIAAIESAFPPEDKSQISDGYHTFDELYDHRMKLFAVICRMFSSSAWKSKLHSDGTMFDDYFIVGIKTGEGQFTYHYHIDHWDMFPVEELERAPEWDGHTSDDVTRLFSLLD